MKERIVTHIIATMIYALAVFYISDGEKVSENEIVPVMYFGLVLNVALAIYYSTTGMFNDKDEDSY